MKIPPSPFTKVAVEIPPMPMKPPEVGVTPFFKCCFCDRVADVIYKGTSCCEHHYRDKTRTGEL